MMGMRKTEMDIKEADKKLKLSKECKTKFYQNSLIKRTLNFDMYLMFYYQYRQRKSR